MNGRSSNFMQGAQACADGKPKSANPYPADSAEHAYWNRGIELMAFLYSFFAEQD